MNTKKKKNKRREIKINFDQFEMDRKNHKFFSHHHDDSPQVAHLGF